MIAAQSRQLVVRVLQLGAAALVWWTSELADMVPDQLTQILRTRDAPAVVLDFARMGSKLTIASRSRSAAETMLVGARSEHDARESVREALQRNRVLQANVVIQIDPSLVLTTTVDLPAAAETSLEAILRHQIDRLVPLRPEDVVFHHRIIERAKDGKTVTVEVTMVKRSNIDAALQSAAVLGLTPYLITQAFVQSEVLGKLRSIPFFWRADRGRVGKTRARRSLELAAFILFGAAYALHVYQLDTVRNALRHDVAAAKQDVVAAQTASSALSRATDALGFFTERHSEPSPLRVMDDLTQLVPLNSSVSQLALRGRAVEITGVSRHANELIPILESSSLFEKPRFKSAITASADGRGERFMLAVDVRFSTDRSVVDRGLPALKKTP